MMLRLIVSLLGVLFAVGCVPHQPIGENQPCPCAPGWQCDLDRQVCVPTDNNPVPDAGDLGDRADTGSIDQGDSATVVVDAGPLPDLSNCPFIRPQDAGNVATIGPDGCSLLGQWRLDNQRGTVQTSGVIDIRADGIYVGGPLGTDLSQTHTYAGSYTVTGSTFELIASCGDGTCLGGGTFDIVFQDSCTLATLTERITECTGNRLSVAGMVFLTRPATP